MKTLKEILSTEKGASAFLLIGTNILYFLAGYALYIALGPVAGIIPVVTSLGLTGFFFLPRLVKEEEPRINYDKQETEQISFNEENPINSNQESLTKEKTTSLATDDYYLNNSEENTMLKNKSDTAKVLVKTYKN